MKVPFAARVFALSFLPVAALLIGSFWSIQFVVGRNVRDGLRASLRQSHSFVSRVRTTYELRNSRLLTALAENPSLKAGFELVGLEPDNIEARRTLEDQLRESSRNLAFDFMAATNAHEALLAGVVRVGEHLSGIDGQGVQELNEGAWFFGDRTYVLTRVPVNLGSESLGSLFVGNILDLADFSAPTVLAKDGHVLQSNLTAMPLGEIEEALARCGPGEECDVALQGETYLCLPMESIHLGDGYVLRSLQSVDEASRPLRVAVANVFLVAGTIALLAISAMSLLSAKSIVKPLTGLIARLQQSESSGVLPSFETTSSTREINLLISAFNQAAVAIRDARDNLTLAYREFIQSLSSAIDARDVYTAGHSRRVSAYAVAIAKEMGLSSDEVSVIREGALLHDVGKIGISDRVLQKPGPLTPEEFELVRRHPSIGRKIIERVEGLAPYLNIVELHHENQDGSGYPWRLAGSGIPLDARIVHVADAYDAMTSDRPYRKGMTRERALAILRENAGTQFDRDVVEAFTRVHPGRMQQEPSDAERGNELDLLGRALDSMAAKDEVEQRTL